MQRSGTGVSPAHGAHCLPGVSHASRTCLPWARGLDDQPPGVLGNNRRGRRRRRGTAAVVGIRAAARQAGQTSRDTAVIQIWLGGGPSQFETYDPKPDAPAEYRGSFGAISTRLPGVQICEVLPRHAELLDRVAILRSVYHNSADHDAGMYFCVTGKGTKFQPSTGSITARFAARTRPACQLMFTWASSR